MKLNVYLWRWYVDFIDQLYGTLKHANTGVIEVWAGRRDGTTKTAVSLNTYSRAAGCRDRICSANES